MYTFLHLGLEKAFKGHYHPINYVYTNLHLRFGKALKKSVSTVIFISKYQYEILKKYMGLDMKKYKYVYTILHLGLEKALKRSQ